MMTASLEDVGVLDKGLRQLCEVIRQKTGIDLQQVKGSGAGGGFAGGMHALLGAELRSGTEVIFEMTGFDTALQWADVVITGEGKMDSQTLRGKLVKGVADRAFTSGKKVIVVCGENALTEEELKATHIQDTYSLVESAGKEESLTNPMKALEDVSRHLAESLKR